jgi:5-methylcytosine-specific restriction protein A
MASTFSEMERGAGTMPIRSKSDGLNDLGDAPTGEESPDRALVTGLVVIRDSKVRNYILKRAGGSCEYCGNLGFKMKNGRHYIEAHHVIVLSKQGKDTVENVIALCPNHHREAHFGAEAEALEKDFMRCIQKRKW